MLGFFSRNNMVRNMSCHLILVFFQGWRKAMLFYRHDIEHGFKLSVIKIEMVLVEKS
jgi:hypothetical protein